MDQTALKDRVKAVIIDTLKSKYSLPDLLKKLELSKKQLLLSGVPMRKFNKYGDIRARIHLPFHENKAVWVSAYLWAPKMGGTHSFRKSGSLGHAGRRTYCHL